MPRLRLPSYTVIRDTREQDGYGWTFQEHSEKVRPPRCVGQVRKKLDTGDYSLLGYEDIVSVERKADMAEVWMNYLSSRNRFEAEMARLSEIKYSMVIIESLLVNEILELSPPQVRTAVPGKSVVRWLHHLSAKFRVPIYWAGNMGKLRTRYFFEEIIRLEKDRWSQA